MLYTLTLPDRKCLTLTATGLAFMPPSAQRPIRYTLSEAQAEAQRITLAHPSLTITLQKVEK